MSSKFSLFYSNNTQVKEAIIEHADWQLYFWDEKKSHKKILPSFSSHRKKMLWRRKKMREIKILWVEFFFFASNGKDKSVPWSTLNGQKKRKFFTEKMDENFFKGGNFFFHIFCLCLWEKILQRRLLGKNLMLNALYFSLFSFN